MLANVQNQPDVLVRGPGNPYPPENTTMLNARRSALVLELKCYLVMERTDRHLFGVNSR